MMPGVARKGDICTGHGCWPSRSSIEGSPDVFVNGIPWHRQMTFMSRTAVLVRECPTVVIPPFWRLGARPCSLMGNKPVEWATLSPVEAVLPQDQVIIEDRKSVV